MRVMMMRVAGALVLTLLPGLALAWFAAGHQTAGAIADRLLQGTYAGDMVRKTLGGMDLKTVSVWADCAKATRSTDGVHFSYEPDLQRFPECSPFTTLEEQARIIAFVKANWTQCGSAHDSEWCHSQYHYTNVAPQRDRYSVHFAGAYNYDVVHAASAMQKMLAGGRAPAPFVIADDREALILLAHYVGDMHQPMHVLSIYLDASGKPVDPDESGLDPSTKTAGGNKIYYDDGVRLHAYWDSTPQRIDVDGEDFEETFALARKVVPTPGKPAGWAKKWASEVMRTGRFSFDRLTYGPRMPQPSGTSELAQRYNELTHAPLTSQVAPGWNVLKGMNAHYFKRAERYKQMELARAGARLAQAIQAIWPEPGEGAMRREASRTAAAPDRL